MFWLLPLYAYLGMCSVFISLPSEAEFARAGEIGLKAELMFALWQYEYEDEEEVVYNNKHYSVYRTYINNSGKVELYCQRKVSNE